MSRFAISQPKPVVDRAIAELVASGTLVPESLRNQPNGFAGLDSSGNLLGTVTHRQGTAAAIDAIVLASGELAFVTDQNEVRRGDGTTAGGITVVSFPVQYASGTDGSGYIPVTSTSPALAAPVNIPVVAGRSYRLRGTFIFDDADSISNFGVSISRVSPMTFGAIHKPTEPSDGNLGWIATSIWYVNQSGATQSQFPVVGRSFSQISTVFAPVDLTRQLQSMSFDYTCGVYLGGTLRIGPFLRTATTLGVNCMYYFEVQRIK